MSVALALRLHRVESVQYLENNESRMPDTQECIVSPTSSVYRAFPRCPPLSRLDLFDIDMTDAYSAVLPLVSMGNRSMRHAVKR
jgi:hypothetical protein